MKGCNFVVSCLNEEELKYAVILRHNAQMAAEINLFKIACLHSAAAVPRSATQRRRRAPSTYKSTSCRARFRDWDNSRRARPKRVGARAARWRAEAEDEPSPRAQRSGDEHRSSCFHTVAVSKMFHFLLCGQRMFSGAHWGSSKTWQPLSFTPR